jgi:GT2 family glycosyltransferase
VTLLVGIPSFRRPAMLAALLESLAAQRQIDDLAIEIFVADNDAGAAEGFELCTKLAPRFRFPLSAATVAEPGISAVRNRILTEAARRGSSLVAMVDDDETVAPDWLAQLVSVAKLHDAEIVGGPVFFAFDLPVSAALRGSGAFPVERRPSGRIPLLEASGTILIDAAALARLGWPGFDTSFGLTGGEDREYFTRLKQAGLSFAWAAEAIAVERVPADRLRTASIMRRAYSVGNSDYRIDRLHGPARARIEHLGKSALMLTVGLLLVPALVVPRHRLWLLRRYARALGRLASAIGHADRRYAGNAVRTA